MTRRQRAERKVNDLQRVERRFPWLRLGVVLVGLLGVYLAFALLTFALAWVVTGLLLILFGYVSRLHQQVIDQIEEVQDLQRILDSRLARARLDWAHIPTPTLIETPAEHPFAADLNVVGARSLHQLIDTCISLGGSRLLASWLLSPVPDPAVISRHQLAARDLLARSAFRSRLELNGLMAKPEKDHRWSTDDLLRWLESHTSAASLRPLLVMLGLLAVVNITLFILNAINLLPAVWVVTVAIFLLLQSLKYRESSEVFSESYGLARQLGQLRAVLSDLEKTPYAQGSVLAEICSPFYQGKQRPSQALRQISRIASAASLRNNPFLSLILNLIVPWDLYFAYQLERYKHELREVLPVWLAAWHELEALASLANFAALNPENTFPEILPPGSQPLLECRAAGHPLIPDDSRVNNDFVLQETGEIVIVTGSNMSGKSTFLRTIGASLILAYAGSTVAAGSMRTVPMRLFSSMNVSDSLNDGISFFYAEVRRLKALLDQLSKKQEQPLLFLIDEIFRGTNNRERQIGSRAYVEALAGKNGAGLISTHDLELAHLDEMIPLVRNAHFREDVRDGKMIFDYKIHPGPSPTTNALRIMAQAGLPVPTTGVKNP